MLPGVECHVLIIFAATVVKYCENSFFQVPSSYIYIYINILNIKGWWVSWYARCYDFGEGMVELKESVW
jgi:hypothetical protein